MSKTAEAFRTISEVAGELDVPKHVLRFWEGKFPQIRPMKRGGGRRYYRPEDLELLRGICQLLHAEGYTIKGVQKILREQGVDHVKRFGTRSQAKTGAGEARAKRGRRAKTPSAAVGAALGTPAPARDSAPCAVAQPRKERGLITAAIAELEICRGLLTGKAISATARRKGSRPRRAARS